METDNITEPNPPREGQEQWQTDLDELREQISNLTLTLQQSQTELKQLTSKPVTPDRLKEIQELKAELEQTRLELKEAQTELKKLGTPMPKPDLHQPKDENVAPRRKWL